MTYATVAELALAAEFYGVFAPEPKAAVRLLERATRDVQTYLGAEHHPGLLDGEQAAALRDATCAQALYRHEQGNPLALDDGLASVGPLSFSMRPAPRFSPEAAEQLAGLGLFARSGTVWPPLDATAP